MSGDSGSKKKKSDKPDEGAVPAYLGGGTQSTFPQAMPGQLESLASQLSAGFGAPVSQNMAFLDALYSPVTIPSKAAAPVSSSPTQSGGLVGILERMTGKEVDPSKIRFRYR